MFGQGLEKNPRSPYLLLRDQDARRRHAVVLERESKELAGLEGARQGNVHAIVVVLKRQRAAVPGRSGDGHPLATGRRRGGGVAAAAGRLRARIARLIGGLWAPRPRAELAEVEIEARDARRDEPHVHGFLDDELAVRVVQRDVEGVAGDLDPGLARIGVGRNPRRRHRQRAGGDSRRAAPQPDRSVGHR